MIGGEEYEQALEDKKRARTLSSELSAATVEDESSSKKVQDMLRRRRHLILLAQNQKGSAKPIFKLISESYKSENFYRYPRMDYDLLAKYSEGVIAASACLGGVYSGNYWENRDQWRRSCS